MEETLDKSLIISATRNLREHYVDILSQAREWLGRNQHKVDNEEYKLIVVVANFADEGIGRCNMNLRLLGEQE